MTERNEMYEAAFTKMRRRNQITIFGRRLGCGGLFLLWAVLMLSPCALLTLVAQGEMTYSHSEIPNDELRVFMIQEQDERGFGLSRTSVESGSRDGDQVCLVTSISYLMWESEGDNESLAYCNCYERSADFWSPTLIGGDESCNPLANEIGE